ncbi:MAG: Fic family protein, partial [Planctomycetes bacterium]|nr:Fic family protein [Planctomycetota bacterium]
MTYVHELPEWPNLVWSLPALAQPLAAVRHKQGRHLGRMEALGFDLRSEANLAALTDEAVRTSAIEGERLNADEVRSSIARRLGLDTAGLPAPSRAVEGVVEMMLDATRQFDQPLTAERLFGWQAALFPTGRSGMYRITVGAWREPAAGPMQIISGPMGRERIHFQAPGADRLDGEMRRFLDWFNGTADLDPVLKAAVAHFWFVTIHPFDDGNGRIARAIADMALARGDGTAERFYSMSARIEAERKDYYLQLESAQRGSTDITSWIAWFLSCLERAIAASDGLLAGVLRKAHLWQALNTKPVNERQRLVINRMLGDWQGFLTTSKYSKLAKCSADTAQRDIKELLERGALVQNEAGGRSTSYQLGVDSGNDRPKGPG